jgi:UDP-4-amino-4-deoxy-L-arabinose-oxoglutarate aminotransferase
MIASGELASRFAEAVRQRVGAADARTAASGMDALSAALRVLGVAAGDEVVIPTYVCSRVLIAVSATGARAVLAEVAADGNLDAETVSAVRTPATKAVIAAHIFGHPCDIAGLRALGLPVVEDACQAFAVPFPQGISGTLGDIGVYSFQATKCLATGEGGMVVSPAATAPADGGATSEMSDLQAALGLSQLDRYDAFLDRRRAIGDALRSAVAGAPGLIAHLPDPALPLFRFTVRTDLGFAGAHEFFAARGVAVRRGVDVLLHREAGLSDARFPTAVRLFESTVSVPCYPALSDTELATVAGALRAFADVA